MPRDWHRPEEVSLDDGTRVALRALGPEDKPLVRRGFERLSPQSRYRRFLSAKKELSDADLSYLCDVDGERHFALGAVVEGPSGPEGIGVARFVRLPGERDVAEPAVAVIDEFQGRGLGRIFLARLVDAARERGVTRFRCDVLASNDAMLALLREVPGAKAHPEGEVVRFDLPIPPAPHEAAASENPLRHLLRLAARGAFALARELRDAEAKLDDLRRP